MATCPKCYTRYPDETLSCEADGEALVPDAAIAAMDREVLPGEMIGEYKIEAKLGEGGFGAVYRAIQPLIGKQVAIKILSRRLSGDPQMVSRFVAEARAVNQIRSRNIVDIFGFGSLSDGRQYFVMELLSGSTLEDYIRQRGRIPVEEAVPILRGIARALDAAHAAGIVHRDLKPENVFLVADEEQRLMPKLLDFGIAKLMGGATGGHKTRTGVPMGTPYYMSPEQCRGDKVDHKTDVYSFGVLAFQALTGALPFGGESFMQIMFAHVSAAPPVPSQAAPGLAPQLDAAILQMLAKAPGDRPESCGAAVEGLAAAARSAGHAVGTLPIGTPAALLGSGTLDGKGLAHASTAIADTGPTTLSALSTTSTKSKTPLVAIGVVALVALVGGGIALAVSRKSSEPTVATATALLPSVTATPPASETAAPPASVTASPVVSGPVLLTLTSEPKQVDVYLGDEKLGTSPSDEIRLERGDGELVLTIKADGYLPEKVKVKPVADVSTSVKLKKKGGGAGKAAPGTGALEY
ncbi:MAG: protein kinase [Polyangiaceae bacterium]|nr:protein kinase [Polyangiaceae bacterium]MCE7888949.1 serine/threonine protein kinase [Sorangiineae bacterium PRO1]